MPSNSSGGRRKRSALTSRFVVVERQSDATIGECAECATCSGRGVVDHLGTPCPECVIPPRGEQCP